MTNLNRYSMRGVTKPADWATYHRIRWEVLFAARGRGDAYDANHPDEHRKNSFPLLLLFDGVPVGTLRLDWDGETAVVRRMAVEASEQRRGHGRAAIGLVQVLASALGASTLEVNSDPSAVGFYQRVGFALIDPDRVSPLLRMPVEKRIK